MIKLKEIKTSDGIFLNLEDDIFIKGSLEEHGYWEKPTIDICRYFLKEDSWVIEVGSHIGSHTIPLSKICKHGFIFAFEMQRIISQLLNTNIIKNNCRNIINYFEAVSNENKIEWIGEIEYREMKEFNSGNISLDLIRKVDSYPIQVVSIDEKFSKLGKLDLIKLDTEGHEVPILKGAMNLIKKFKPLILTEFDVNNKQEIINLLPEYKFEDVSYYYELKGAKYLNLMFKGTFRE